MTEYLSQKSKISSNIESFLRSLYPPKSVSVEKYNRFHSFLQEFINPDGKLNALLRQSKGAGLTGSAALWWHMRPEHRTWLPADVDIFKVDEPEESDSVFQGLKALGWRHVHQDAPYDFLCLVSHRWINDAYPGLTINVVLVETAQNENDVINHVKNVFDFDVCQFFFNGQQWSGPSIVMDRMITFNPKRLDLMKTVHQWMLEKLRMERYQARGFGFTNAELCKKNYDEACNNFIVHHV